MKPRRRDYLLINSYWFGLTFLWNGMHSIILPAVIIGMVPWNLKGTYLGGMTFAGLLLAMLVQPLSGALSDQTRSGWGRRRPWILGGTIAVLLSLILFGMAERYLLLVVAYLLLQLSGNLIHGPLQGLIPDLVPHEHRGIASGVKNLLDIAGFVGGALVIGYLIGHGEWGAALAAIGIVLLVVLGITLTGVREPPAEAVAPRNHSLRATFHLDVRKYPTYAWLLVSRFLILAGIYVIQGFAQFFIHDVLGAASAARVTGQLMVVLGVLTAALVGPAGYLSDRWGRKKLNVAAGFLCALAVFLLTTVNSYATLLAVGALLGAGLGSFLAVNWALATELVPIEEAGKYLGLSNLATAGAGAMARLGGPIIDIFNVDEALHGYTILFIIAGCLVLVGTLILWRKVRIPEALSARPAVT